jgi:hypothetical protein
LRFWLTTGSCADGSGGGGVCSVDGFVWVIAVRGAASARVCMSRGGAITQAQASVDSARERGERFIGVLLER